MSAPLDREQLRRDLSDALSAIQRAHDVTGLDVLAATLQTLNEAPYAFHGSSLAEGPGCDAAELQRVDPEPGPGAGQAGRT
jgi:hypothetical protein